VLAGPDVGRSLAWTRENRVRTHRAAWHGFREDSTAAEWDGPELWEAQPSREWCAAFYAAHRGRFVASFHRGAGFLVAWAVAEFETSPGVRAAADRALAAHMDRRRRLAPLDERSGDDR
jgi:hypothetical protein